MLRDSECEYKVIISEIANVVAGHTTDMKQAKMCSTTYLVESI